MNGTDDDNNDVWEREPEGKPGVQVNLILAHIPT